MRAVRLKPLNKHSFLTNRINGSTIYDINALFSYISQSVFYRITSFFLTDFFY